MSIQRISGQLPVYQPDPTLGVLSDMISNGGGYSQGRASVITLADQPALGQLWSLLGWSLTYSGQMISSPAAAQIAGRLGRLSAGLISGAAVPILSGALASSPPPSDATMLDTLWDGASDPPFAWGPQQDVRTHALQLPQPLAMQSGDTLSFGLWLTPSLLTPVNDGGYITLSILAATYSVLYDDGR